MTGQIGARPAGGPTPSPPCRFWIDFRLMLSRYWIKIDLYFTLLLSTPVWPMSCHRVNKSVSRAIYNMTTVSWKTHTLSSYNTSSYFRAKSIFTLLTSPTRLPARLYVWIGHGPTVIVSKLSCPTVFRSSRLSNSNPSAIHASPRRKSVPGRLILWVVNERDRQLCHSHQLNGAPSFFCEHSRPFSRFATTTAVPLCLKSEWVIWGQKCGNRPGNFPLRRSLSLMVLTRELLFSNHS